MSNSLRIYGGVDVIESWLLLTVVALLVCGALQPHDYDYGVFMAANVIVLYFSITCERWNKVI